jgi:Holliday junction resolvase RusA-like endonuclease
VKRSWSATLLGEPRAKGNRRRIVRNRGVPRIIKDQVALAYVEHIRVQAAAVRPPVLLEGRLRFTATLYYRTQRPDLDASLLLDALEGIVYANDRQVREIHLTHAIDRENPRADVVVEEIE